MLYVGGLIVGYMIGSNFGVFGGILGALICLFIAYLVDDQVAGAEPHQEPEEDENPFSGIDADDGLIDDGMGDDMNPVSGLPMSGDTDVGGNPSGTSSDL